MNRSMILPLAVLICGLFQITAWAETAVTVYNNDLGLVRETRAIHLEKGAHEVTLTDVGGADRSHFGADQIAHRSRNPHSGTELPLRRSHA